jgi:uncharacterized protein (UPF0276 family)
MAFSTAQFDHRSSIPARAGIGLRAPHYRDILALLPDIGWVEVHSENYFGPGGPPLFYLEQVRKHYPLSLHGVGLSLGSTDALNIRHLGKLKGLIDRFEPGLVSDHLCWSSVGGRYLNDLLPLPYTEEALAHVCKRIVQVQEYLGQPILIENLSSYLEYSHTTIAEWEFISELARRADCGILLDVNNVYVSACNHGFDAHYYLASVPVNRIMEIHLAGFTVNRFEGGEILIDTHNQPVAEEVWRLYEYAVERFGRKPALIEWDTALPALQVLVDEAGRADRVLEATHALAA